MRVYTAVLATETNTFSPVPTGLDAFRLRGEYFPPGQHPDTACTFSAPFMVCRERAAQYGWQVVEGPYAFAQPGGATTAPAWAALREEMINALKAALPVDIVILGLHGAMVAEDCDDCEGALLAEVRALVGDKAVIGTVIDPHCHLTEEMRANADMVITFKNYPHDDIHERTVELVDLCRRIHAGEIKPQSALLDLEMVSLMFTTAEPGAGIVRAMQEMETRPGVLSVSLAQGFPWADVPAMGSKTLVYTDGKAAMASELARELGDLVYSQRETLRAAQPDIDTVLDQALAAPEGPIVIAEGADNAGGGAASDSTFVLRRILERGIRDVALGPIWDPVAASFAFDAGIGARLALRIGGKVGPASGDPIDATVTVKALQRNMSETAFGTGKFLLGDCALVEIDGVEIVLTSIRGQALDTDLFTNLGCDLTNKRIVLVKSTQHFYNSYAKIAKEVLYVASTGTVTVDLDSLPYRRIQKPKWPLAG